MLNSIFDELKEVQYYKEMTDFKSFMMQKYFKESSKSRGVFRTQANGVFL